MKQRLIFMCLFFLALFLICGCAKNQNHTGSNDEKVTTGEQVETMAPDSSLTEENGLTNETEDTDIQSPLATSEKEMSSVSTTTKHINLSTSSKTTTKTSVSTSAKITSTVFVTTSKGITTTTKKPSTTTTTTSTTTKIPIITTQKVPSVIGNGIELPEDEF